MHIDKGKFVTALVGAAALTAVATAVGSAAADPSGALHAEAELRDTSGAVVGRATFTEDANGRLHVNVKVDGLPTGLHGAHVHRVGACTPTFAAAGTHHNPTGGLHGSHGGDLPNLSVNTAGRGTLNAAVFSATLSAGPLTVFDSDGSALVIHADPDDGVTDPTGNSGARVACGVLVAT